MRRLIVLSLIFFLFFNINAMAATQQEIQYAIDDGLVNLATTMTQSGSEGYWSYANSGTLAATASAALAFVEAGYLPGNNVIINGIDYGDIVGMACNYIFIRAYADNRFMAIGPGGMETVGYTRYAEDYNSDGILNDGGNNQAIYFEPGQSTRRLYTTGIVTPLVYALGEAFGPDTEVGMGNLTSSMTYREVLRDLIDWFSWGQVEPNRGNQRGGWRYDANYADSDNSTAQWPALAIIYGKNWGLTVPQYVKDELKLWTDYIQNDNGGSGYSDDYTYVNVAKTGGLLLQFFAMGYEIGENNSDTPYNNIVNEVDAAIAFINSRWNTTPYSTWYGNLNHSYAMWAVYKALQLYGSIEWTNFYPGDDSEFVIGNGITSAPGGFEIGQDWQPYESVQGDWYSHYCDYLLSIQNANGSWSGYSYWTGALATGWYINILNATPVSPTINPTPQNVKIVVGKKTAFLSWTCDNSSDSIYFLLKYRIKDSGANYQYCLDENGDIREFSITNAIITELQKKENYEFIVETILYDGEDQFKYPSKPVYGKIPDVTDIKFNHSILLIPGTGGHANGWNKMKSSLESLGIKYGGTLKLERQDTNKLGTNWVNEFGDPESIGQFYVGEYNDVIGSNGSLLFHPCGRISNNYTPTKLFIDEIRRIEKKITDKERSTILVGQSLGGLRARAYLQKKDRDQNDYDVTKKVDGLVTIGTPNLGVLQDHAKYDVDADIFGAWRIMMGNAEEDENDFFMFLQSEDEDYKFDGGYINDDDRYDMDQDGNKDYKRNKLYVQRLLEYLRSGTIFTSGNWDFTKEGLKEDVISGSEFLNNLNFWINSSCSEGESGDCSFSIKDGCEDGLCNNDYFNHLPKIYYKYLVGKNPEGSPSFLLRDWKWYNYFMFKDQNEGDGFISEISQNFMPYHLSINSEYVDMIERPGKSHQDELTDHIGLLEALGFKTLKVIAKCPVDISVESPSGLIQSKTQSEMPGATYNEADIDGDGDLDRFIEIPFPEQGEHKITVTPMEGAVPNQTFTLEVEQDRTVTVLKENEPIGNLDGTPETVDINAIPIADAGPDQTEMAETYGIAQVTLNGSESSDSGSTAGTNNDIVSFEWFNGMTKIAEGEIVEVTLGVGEHQIELLVTDEYGAQDTDIVLITVEALPAMTGDIDGDYDVDRNDLNVILSLRNKPASDNPECDLDGDGMITALDARLCVTLCTRSRCATE